MNSLGRPRRCLLRPDYRVLHSVGLRANPITIQTMSGEDNKLDEATGGSKEDEISLEEDEELKRLQEAVSNKEAERKKLIDAKKRHLKEQLDKTSLEVEGLKAASATRPKTGMKETDKKTGIKEADTVTIKTLRKNKTLKEKVASQLRKLGLDNDLSEDSTSSESETSDSDSDSDASLSSIASNKHSEKKHSSHSKKKKTKKSKKKSGIKSKASDKVKFPQKWPQASLQFEFVTKNAEFKDLSFKLLVAGELEIISECTSKLERKGRIALLKKLAYYSNTYSIEGLRNYYSSCLRQIEQGHKTWAADFSNLEQPILLPHVIDKPQFKKRSFNTGSFTSFNSKGKKPEETSDKVWFCSLYNRNRCNSKSDHTVVVNGSMRYALHICASCWQIDKKKQQHAECSKECPHAVTK